MPWPTERTRNGGPARDVSRAATTLAWRWRDGRRCVGIVLESGKRDSHVGDAWIQGPTDGNADLAGQRTGEECGQDHGIREKGARRRRDYTDGNGHALGQSGAEEEIDSTRRIKAPGCGAF